MDARTFRMHYAAARFAGKDSCCGTKIRYPSEQTAEIAAFNLHRSRPEKDFEAYPCGFCLYWHVGREYTRREKEKWLRISEVMAEEGVLDSIPNTELLMHNWNH